MMRALLHLCTGLLGLLTPIGGSLGRSLYHFQDVVSLTLILYMPLENRCHWHRARLSNRKARSSSTGSRVRRPILKIPKQA